MWVTLILIFIPIIVCAVVIVVKIVLKIKHGRGDYGDGGGIHIGVDEHVSFFAPVNERAGIFGEKRVNYHLKPLLRNDEYLLTNLILPLWNGDDTEIDCVLISRKGIFCIEIKNWVGHINGSDKDDFWIQKYDDPNWKNKCHKNPVKQNNWHCTILSEKLNNCWRVNNVVIFCRMEYRRKINSNHTFNIRQFKNYYRSLDSNIIPGNSLKIIYKILEPYIANLQKIQEHRTKMKAKN